MCFLRPDSTWCFYPSANILFQLFSIRRMHIWQHATAERKRGTQHLFFQSAGHCKCFNWKISKLHKMVLGFTTFSGNQSFTRRFPTCHLSPRWPRKWRTCLFHLCPPYQTETPLGADQLDACCFVESTLILRISASKFAPNLILTSLNKSLVSAHSWGLVWRVLVDLDTIMIYAIIKIITYSIACFKYQLVHKTK